MTTRSKECWAYLKQTVVKDESSQSSESQQQSDSQNAPSPLTIRRQLFQLSKHINPTCHNIFMSRIN